MKRIEQNGTRELFYEKIIENEWLDPLAPLVNPLLESINEFRTTVKLEVGRQAAKNYQLEWFKNLPNKKKLESYKTFSHK